MFSVAPHVCVMYAVFDMRQPCATLSGVMGLRTTPALQTAARLPRLGAAAALAAALALLTAAPAPAADDDSHWQDASLIEMLLQNDLMYGTDDFMGEHTDLSYADGVTPTPAAAPAPAVAAPAAATHRSSSSRQTETTTSTPPSPPTPPPEPPEPPDPPPV